MMFLNKHAAPILPLNLLLQESIQHMIENNASMGSRGGQEKPGGAGGH